MQEYKSKGDGQFLDEEIGTLCSPCSGKRGSTGVGVAGGGAGQEADITLLHSPYVLIVSRS